MVELLIVFAPYLRPALETPRKFFVSENKERESELNAHHHVRAADTAAILGAEAERIAEEQKSIIREVTMELIARLEMIFAGV